MALFGKGRIARRLVMATVIFSACITLAATLYQLYVDYRHDLKTIHGHFTLIENSYLKSLARSVWLYDVRQITTQLGGLKTLPDMEYLEIRTAEGDTWSFGKRRSTHTLTENFPLSFRHKNQTFSIGTLNVTTSLDNVYDRLMDKTLTILALNAVRAFCVSGFILLIFQLFVTRHLVELADRVIRIDLNSITGRIRLNRKRKSSRPDEIDQVVHALNQMQAKLHQSYAALHESEDKFRNFTEQSLVGIYLIQDGVFKYVNSKFAEIFGYSVEACTDNMLVSDLVHPDDRATVAEKIRARLEGKTKSAQYEFRGIKRNGEIVYVAVFGSSAPYNGKPAAIGTLIDITRRKRAEIELRTSEANFRVLYDNAPDMYVSVSPDDGSILRCNETLLEVTGYSREEIVGFPIFKMYHNDCMAEVKKAFQQFVETGSVQDKELILKSKDGSKIDVSLNVNSVRDENGKTLHSISSWRDITERKKLEAQLQQAQKMESIGTLAGGIAHDFNNILFPIVGNTELLLEDIPADSPLRDNLNAVFNSAMRARDLVKQILAFSRQERHEIKLIRIQPVIEEALSLIRSTIPTSIEIEQNVSPDCGPIRADATQIHQVVMNLATNAFHAMEDSGGALTVNLMEIEFGDQDLPGPDMESGPYACLTVADTGTGIDGNIRQKIFDPFFTTKEQGKGTGMGLSVIHGIIHRAGGNIQVNSEPGQGTEFHVYLPVVKSSSEQQEVQARAAIQGGSGQILLVDDEEAVVFMERQMLERLGYRVTARVSGVEALEAFKAYPSTFDIVITDMTMPNMTGDQLAKELLAIRPDIPIVICTGFSEKIDDDRAHEMGVKGFLMKPVVKSEMAKMVRKVLDGGET